MAFTPWGPGTPGLVAATPYPAGFPLQNGTSVILSWTAPADGRQHRVAIFGQVNVTSAETGGALATTFTEPGGAVLTPALAAGGHAAGYVALSNTSLVVAPGTTVTLAQSSALTAGAAAAYLELWAS